MIGYRISAGSPIGRSPRTVAAPAPAVTTDLLRKNVDSLYTLSCPTLRRGALSYTAAPLSLLHSAPRRPSPRVSPSPLPPPSYPARSLATHLAWPPLRRSSTYRHRPQRVPLGDRGRNGIERTRRRGKSLFFFIGAVRRCLLVRPGRERIVEEMAGRRAFFLRFSLYLRPLTLGPDRRPGRFRARDRERGKIDRK